MAQFTLWLQWENGGLIFYSCYTVWLDVTWLWSSSEQGVQCCDLFFVGESELASCNARWHRWASTWKFDDVPARVAGKRRTKVLRTIKIRKTEPPQRRQKGVRKCWSGVRSPGSEKRNKVGPWALREGERGTITFRWLLGSGNENEYQARENKTDIHENRASRCYWDKGHLVLLSWEYEHTHIQHYDSLTPPTLERRTVNTTAFTAIMTQARQKAGSGSDIY